MQGISSFRCRWLDVIVLWGKAGGNARLAGHRSWICSTSSSSSAGGSCLCVCVYLCGGRFCCSCSKCRCFLLLLSLAFIAGTIAALWQTGFEFWWKLRHRRCTTNLHNCLPSECNKRTPKKKKQFNCFFLKHFFLRQILLSCTWNSTLFQKNYCINNMYFLKKIRIFFGVRCWWKLGAG